MRPLSATEAITPAIEHTKAMLRPFSLALWFKLGLVAVVAEMGGQFVGSPPVGILPHPAAQTSGIGAIAAGISPAWILGLIAFLIVGLLLALGLFYLSSRLQLVLMDLVATRTTFVGDAWHRTASRTWRWIGGKILFFLVLLLALAALAAAPIVYLIHAFAAAKGNPGGAIIGTIIIFCIALFFVILLVVLAIWALRDFVLPYILFEDAPFPDALSRAWTLFRNEPGAILFYFFMKFVVCLVAGIATEFCIFAIALVAAIPTGLLGWILWASLHHSGTLGTVILYASLVLLGMLFVAVFLVAAICIGGAALIFYQAYALYFIGGRIPQVGVLLQPLPPPFFPPPVPAAPFTPA